MKMSAFSSRRRVCARLAENSRQGGQESEIAHMRQAVEIIGKIFCMPPIAPRFGHASGRIRSSRQCRFFSLAIQECWFTIGILTGAFGLVVGMAWRSRDEIHSYKVGSVCGTRSPGDLPRLWGRFNDFVPAGNRPFTTAAATAAAHRHAIPEPERSAS